MEETHQLMSKARGLKEGQQRKITSKEINKIQEDSSPCPKTAPALEPYAPTREPSPPSLEVGASNQASTLGNNAISSPTINKPDQQLVVYRANHQGRTNGMAWSPERLSGRKRAGSPRGSGAQTTSSARRLNPLQDLNLPPMEGEDHRAPTRTRLEWHDIEATPTNLIGREQQAQNTHIEVRQEAEADRPSETRLESSPSSNSFRQSLISPNSELRPESSSSEPEVVGPLSQEEENLITELGDPFPLQLPIRDVREVAFGLEGTTLSAPRLDRYGQRLRENRSIAEPYGNMVQITRKEVDLRIPTDQYGARRLLVISESLERILSSERSLPWAS
jgi:hypothetical protein